MINRMQPSRALVFGLILFMAGATAWAGPVNINTADAATISRELKGIGLKHAQAIVEYRQKHGPFKTVDEIVLVKGIGPAALARNRELIRIDVRQVPNGTQNPAAPAVSKKP